MTSETEYLLALYIAEQRSSPPVPPGRIADAVGRSPAATTEMLQRLEDRGLVDRKPYDGVALTEAGRERAADRHEAYVALSWFFRDALGLDAHEREAMEMSGLVSPTVADRLVDLLLDEVPNEPAAPGALSLPRSDAD
ncbi:MULTISPECIES: metal-dependent transcriptional regulator [Halorubrum]|uniref:Iron-dependent repressor n=1 Tax=Halorubrum hochstenium ATCC 700873 TaxID=1227481 RepID=M0F5X2_9EURY|nr:MULTISPECIES: metal-dependent transcriptional regulator [Halorubrum]ELZ54637.1 iron-dependent repressor [Halorubrum hochstenium ATCC 700873]